MHPTPRQCTLSHACHAKAAEPKEHQTEGGTPGRIFDPLAMHFAPRQKQLTPRGHASDPCQGTLSHACRAKASEPKGRRRNATGTPGHISDPLAMHSVPRLPCKSSGAQGIPEGCQRVTKGTPENHQKGYQKDAREMPEKR